MFIVGRNLIPTICSIFENISSEKVSDLRHRKVYLTLNVVIITLRNIQIKKSWSFWFDWIRQIERNE